MYTVHAAGGVDPFNFDVNARGVFSTNQIAARHFVSWARAAHWHRGNFCLGRIASL
jgi:hypothetical protein